MNRYTSAIPDRPTAERIAASLRLAACEYERTDPARARLCADAAAMLQGSRWYAVAARPPLAERLWNLHAEAYAERIRRG